MTSHRRLGKNVLHTPKFRTGHYSNKVSRACPICGKEMGGAVFKRAKSGKALSDKQIISLFSNVSSDTKSKLAAPLKKIMSTV